MSTKKNGDRRRLESKLRHLPARPGVYMLKDAAGEILYVGKAVSLRWCVRNHSPLTRRR